MLDGLTPATQPSIGLVNTNNDVKRNRSPFLWRFAQVILVAPAISTVEFSCRLVKLITWDIGKAGTLKFLGYHAKAASFLEKRYLQTGKVALDILLTFSNAGIILRKWRAKADFVDDLPRDISQSYLSVDHVKVRDKYSSNLYGIKKCTTIHPLGIKEFPAESDGSLNTVMASHFLNSDAWAICFGVPNLATFVTEKNKDGSMQTKKVDAASLWRKKPEVYNTKGKMQSGIYFVATNLPPEAKERYNEAAKSIAEEGTANITCVNTNCRVLKKAGFSIVGTDMEDIVLPKTFMEHLHFGDVFYTDNEGKRHKVHFDIINTTIKDNPKKPDKKYDLQKHFEKVNLAVVGTWLRHLRRYTDTEENRQVRGANGRALIAEEKKRLEALPPAERVAASELAKRKVIVSVPSSLGNIISKFWGEHDLFEMDFSDKKDEIAKAFAGKQMLQAFPHENPGFFTRLKRDFFFAQPMIDFLHRHLMGYADVLDLDTKDLFEYLKGAGRLNYVVQEDKIIVAKIDVDEGRKGFFQKLFRDLGNWIMSKHGLLAERKVVHCSGELWYEEENGEEHYFINGNSGTYLPDSERVEITANFVNSIFSTQYCKKPFVVTDRIA